EAAGAVRAFVERCRYPHHPEGVNPSLPSPLARMHGEAGAPHPPALGVGTRGRGSEATAAPIWGISEAEYRERCDPWPLNPAGELLLGIKLESPEGIARCEEILGTPGLGKAEPGGPLPARDAGSARARVPRLPGQSHRVSRNRDASQHHGEAR